IPDLIISVSNPPIACAGRLVNAEAISRANQTVQEAGMMALGFVTCPPGGALRAGDSGLGVSGRRMRPVNCAMVPKVNVTVVAVIAAGQGRQESVVRSRQGLSIRTKSIRVRLPVIIGE